MKNTYEKKIILTSPSRLHFGLIDLNGSLQRIDGSIGLTISKPGFQLIANKSDKIEVNAPLNILDRSLEVIYYLKNKYKIEGGINLNFKRSIPTHIGLGSGTQLILSVAYIFANLYNIKISTIDIARHFNRGGTSGIGILAFKQGGFLVDGGHSFGSVGVKKFFSPSSAVKGVPPPPVLIHYHFPNWKILLIVPNVKIRVFGLNEKNLFQNYCPIPLKDVRKICHLLLMKMLPSIKEEDLRSFGDGINKIQELGWKKFEIKHQHPIISKTMNFLRKSGVYGAGLSSWGPCIYAVGDDLEEHLKKCKDFLKKIGGNYILTEANNRGAVIR